MGKRPLSLREVLGKNIRLERVRREMTQEALAELASSDQTYVSAIERGTKAASVDVIERLARALKVRPVDLLDETLGKN
jgi:transcriptional regulator with XRE-family HTH domain